MGPPFSLIFGYSPSPLKRHDCRKKSVIHEGVYHEANVPLSFQPSLSLSYRLLSGWGTRCPAPGNIDPSYGLDYIFQRLVSGSVHTSREINAEPQRYCSCCFPISAHSRLIQAVVAVEDARFYSHPGFDLEAIARAALVNLQSGDIEEGASTITQQLVKNLFLSPEQSLERKIEELALAIDFEFRYSKNEILSLYLNTIYFGSGYYGIYDAAHGYFGKDPSQLSLPEAAMLAGIPNAPSLYSPYESFLMAKKRQFVVLDAMVRAGYIDERTATEAKIEPLYLAH